MTTETTPQIGIAVLNDPRMYVLAWLSLNAITVNERGELQDSLLRDNSAIFNTMWLDYRANIRTHNVAESQKLPRDRQVISQATLRDLQMAMDELIEKEKATHRLITAQSIKCPGNDLTELEKFIEALTGKVDPKEVAVMAHWLWMVKRKMLKKDVAYHIMPILHGPQGSGKTVALNKLISPLEVYRLNIKMNQMTDDRYFQSMAENYVVVFDEMQGASRTDIDALKNQITTDWNDSRKLSTHNVVKLRQACSFIGASNKPVSEMIIDSTGMRRFYQINTLSCTQWDRINKIDYMKIWSGINESLTEGYIGEYLTDIKKIQEMMVHKDEMSLFIEEMEISGDSSKSTPISSEDLYQTYKRWSSESGYEPKNKSLFGRSMSTKGFKSKTAFLQGKTSNVYSINSSSKIFNK
jgi:hypothetical protein